jgi:diguanylate cyclase (GGDEF)-like protein
MEKTEKSKKLRSLALFALGLVLIVLIGLVDYLSGAEISFSIFYLVPILFITWKMGRKAGVFISVSGAIIWFVSDNAVAHYSHSLIPYWNAFVRLGFFLITSLMLSKLKSELEKEKELGRIDPLTGVNNSRSFYEAASSEIERSKRYGHIFSAAYIDLDDFKSINDNLGHSTGDQLLHQVAFIMRQSLRKIDVTSRVGGDEFVVLMPETDEKTAKTVIERLQKNLMESMNSKGWPVTFSVGAVTFITPPKSVNDMIKEADNLMYRAKQEGKNRIVLKLNNFF